MTQLPQPPQMPPPEPLDEAERAIARALRSLPSGSPPPELDARILGAARRAVHLAPPRKREGRRWLLGFGTAATALFAVGIMLKTHGPAQDSIYTPPAETTAADGSPAAANPPSPQTRTQSMPAANSIGDQAAAADAASATAIESPPPLPQRVIMQAPQLQKDMAAQAREEAPADHFNEAAKAAPEAFPSAPAKQAPRRPPPLPLPPPPVILDEPMPMSPPSPPAPAAMPAPAASIADERAERKTEESDMGRRDAQAGGMAAQAPASVAGSLGRIEPGQAADKQADDLSQQDNAAFKAKSLDEITVAGSRVKRGDTSLPAPSSDAALNPLEWIERIRERIRKGDRAGAVASLKTLVAAHPETAIPDDLQSLLR